jgi:benzaldehyde dehydrogenase (NAD)
MTYDVKLLIGADNAAASNGATVDRIGPVTGKTESVFAAATVDDVNAAAEAAQRAFSSWSKTGPNVRRRILLKAADAIEARASEFTAIMMAETGATTLWGMGNAKLAAETVREAAAMTTRILGETIPSDRPGTVSLALRKPVGVMHRTLECAGCSWGARDRDANRLR